MTAPADPVAVLTTAWLRWEATPASRPAVTEKFDALHTLGLHPSRAHRAIANARRHHIAGLPGGMSIPDAIQTLINNSTKETS